MQTQMKYWAFLSYSHQDTRVCEWLHAALESFHTPRRLVDRETPLGKVPKRLFPVFRDRDELPGSAELGTNLTEALAQSRALVVICSPAAARSRWVNEEIRQFKMMGGEGRILALIVAGEPNAADKPDCGLLECFPEALKYRVDSSGNLTGQRVEPIAADLRRGHESRHIALLRIVAGLLGVPFDELRQRDRERRKRLTGWGIAVATICLIALSSGYYWLARLERMDRLEELGREALMQNRPTHAAVYLSQAYSLGNDNRGLRIMLDQAMRSVDMLITIHSNLTGGTAHAEFDPDATRLLATDTSGSIRLWRADNGGTLVSPKLGNNPTKPKFARFIEGGRAIASVFDDGRIVISDARSGDIVREVTAGLAPLSPARQPAASDIVLFGSERGDTLIFDAARGRPLTRLPPGCRIAAIERDAALCVDDVAETAWIHDLHATNAPQRISLPAQVVAAALFHGAESGTGPGTARAALAFADGTLRFTGLLDAAAPVLVHHPGGIEVVRIAASGAVVASGGTTGGVLVWSAESGQLLTHIQAHAGPVRDLLFLSDDRRLATLGGDGALKVWDLAGSILLSVSQTGQGTRALAALSPDRSRMAIWSDINNLRDNAPGDVWSGVPLTVWDLEAAGPAGATADDRMDRAAEVAAGQAADPIGPRCGGRLRRESHDDGRLLLIDTATGRMRTELEAGLDTTDAELDCDTELTWYLTGGKSGAAVLWEAASGKPVARFAGHSRGLRGVVLRAETGEAMTFAEDGTTARWTFASETRLPALVARRVACRVPLQLDGYTLTASMSDSATCVVGFKR